jgi:hypothetical protein
MASSQTKNRREIFSRKSTLSKTHERLQQKLQKEQSEIDKVHRTLTEDIQELYKQLRDAAPNARDLPALKALDSATAIMTELENAASYFHEFVHVDYSHTANTLQSLKTEYEHVQTRIAIASRADQDQEVASPESVELEQKIKSQWAPILLQRELEFNLSQLKATRTLHQLTRARRRLLQHYQDHESSFFAMVDPVDDKDTKPSPLPSSSSSDPNHQQQQPQSTLNNNTREGGADDDDDTMDDDTFVKSDTKTVKQLRRTMLECSNLISRLNAEIAPFIATGNRCQQKLDRLDTECQWMRADKHHYTIALMKALGKDVLSQKESKLAIVDLYKSLLESESNQDPPPLVLLPSTPLADAAASASGSSGGTTTNAIITDSKQSDSDHDIYTLKQHLRARLIHERIVKSSIEIWSNQANENFEKQKPLQAQLDDHVNHYNKISKDLQIASMPHLMSIEKCLISYLRSLEWQLVVESNQKKKQQQQQQQQKNQTVEEPASVGEAETATTTTNVSASVAVPAAATDEHHKRNVEDNKDKEKQEEQQEKEQTKAEWQMNRFRNRQVQCFERVRQFIEDQTSDLHVQLAYWADVVHKHLIPERRRFASLICKSTVIGLDDDQAGVSEAETVIGLDDDQAGVSEADHAARMRNSWIGSTFVQFLDRLIKVASDKVEVLIEASQRHVRLLLQESSIENYMYSSQYITPQFQAYAQKTRQGLIAFGHPKLLLHYVKDELKFIQLQILQVLTLETQQVTSTSTTTTATNTTLFLDDNDDNHDDDEKHGEDRPKYARRHLRSLQDQADNKQQQQVRPRRRRRGQRLPVDVSFLSGKRNPNSICQAFAQELETIVSSIAEHTPQSDWFLILNDYQGKTTTLKSNQTNGSPKHDLGDSKSFPDLVSTSNDLIKEEHHEQPLAVSNFQRQVVKTVVDFVAELRTNKQQAKFSGSHEILWDAMLRVLNKFPYACPPTDAITHELVRIVARCAFNTTTFDSIEKRHRAVVAGNGGDTSDNDLAKTIFLRDKFMRITDILFNGVAEPQRGVEWIAGLQQQFDVEFKHAQNFGFQSYLSDHACKTMVAKWKIESSRYFEPCTLILNGFAEMIRALLQHLQQVRAIISSVTTILQDPNIIAFTQLVSLKTQTTLDRIQLELALTKHAPPSLRLNDRFEKYPTNAEIGKAWKQLTLERFFEHMTGLNLTRRNSKHQGAAGFWADFDLTYKNFEWPKPFIYKSVCNNRKLEALTDALDMLGRPLILLIADYYEEGDGK